MREDKGNTLRKLTGKGVGWVVSDSAGPREPSPKLAARKAERGPRRHQSTCSSGSWKPGNSRSRGEGAAGGLSLEGLSKRKLPRILISVPSRHTGRKPEGCSPDGGGGTASGEGLCGMARITLNPPDVGTPDLCASCNEVNEMHDSH